MRYLLLFLLGLVGYLLYRRVVRPAQGGSTARGEPGALGLETQEVARPLPVVAIGGRTFRLVEGRCASYRLPAHAPGAARYQLLQRAGTTSGDLPDGWQLVLTRGSLTAGEREVLARITRQWTEGFLEVEADDQGIVAFVEPGAGEAAVWRVHGFLKDLAAAR